MAQEYVDTVYTQEYEWDYDVSAPFPIWGTGGADYIVSVSDPGLKQVVARQQALDRACFWYVMRDGVDLSLVTDFFVSNSFEDEEDDEYLGTKVLELIVISAPLPAIEWEVLYEDSTLYGERILGVKPKTVNTEKGGEIFLSLMVSHRQEDLDERNDIRFEWIFKKYPIYPQQDTLMYKFVMKGDWAMPLCMVYFNNRGQDIPCGDYRYEQAGRYSGSIGYDMNYGIWSTQLLSLFDAIRNNHWPEVKVKNLSDNFSGEEDDLARKNLNLSRHIISEKICIAATQMGISENKLHIDWKISTKKR